MLFVDQATITVKAGDGGKGCEAYAQPPYTRSPYPDGGNGGHGGSVFLEADHNLSTLLDFRYRHEYKAKRGAHGGGNNRTGRNGEDMTLKVPVGTLVVDLDQDCILKDLNRHGQRLEVARGGRGGFGNANSEESLDSQPGEERRLRLELKLIADVGFIGLPNAGKSSMLSRLSTARPKIAGYPFTTRYPVLGMVQPQGREPFAACDIPGLIEGASEGKGLGLRFLRHIERTGLLVHLIDMAGTDGVDPVVAYRQINQELTAYSQVLRKKPQIIVANKMDIPEAKGQLERFTKAIQKPVLAVSCVTGQGIPEMLHAICDALEKMAKPVDGE